MDISCSHHSLTFGTGWSSVVLILVYPSNHDRVIIDEDRGERICVKCAQAGIEEKYIDAFCGRISQNVIRKHYTDYSPEAMRRHYDKVEPFLGLPFSE